jgi:hypothetical protein
MHTHLVVQKSIAVSGAPEIWKGWEYSILRTLLHFPSKLIAEFLLQRMLRDANGDLGFLSRLVSSFCSSVAATFVVYPIEVAQIRYGMRASCVYVYVCVRMCMYMCEYAYIYMSHSLGVHSFPLLIVLRNIAKYPPGSEEDKSDPEVGIVDTISQIQEKEGVTALWRGFGMCIQEATEIQRVEGAFSK